MARFARSAFPAAMALALAMAPLAAQADEAATQRHGATEQWMPLSLEELDALRGGFITSTGLVLSLGIERVAFVNGELVASTRVDIPNIAQLTDADAAALSQFTGTTLVQVGEGNHFDAAGLNGLVIQNTRDGQTISALTTLNVSVNTLDLLQSLNLNSTLQDALHGAAVPP